MSETTTATQRNWMAKTVHRHDRDWGMPKRTDTSAVDDVHLTTHGEQVIRAIQEGEAQ